MAVRVFQFGDFTLDCDRFELRRGDRSLKLERKPMELLILLAAKNGHLVTRTEIAEQLWDSKVFVDTEHGINTAIRKIRQALRDESEQPRFVQTVPGKGYRFIGSIESAAEIRPPDISTAKIDNASTTSAPPSVLPEPVPAPAPLPATTETRPSRNSRLRIWFAAIGAVAALALLVLAINLRARSLRDRSPDRFPDRSPDRSSDRSSTRSSTRAAVPAIRSLAVLPLDNLSGDPAQNYFADGMTDELTTMLAKNSTLRIVSRTSVMQYKAARRPLPEIARELGVDGILEGSVARSGDKVHMTIQLIQAASDTHVWAESYDRNANDVVTLPREAAQTIAKRLDSAVLQPVAQRYVNPEAHDDYLRGRYLWFLDKNKEAGPYFKKATELQPDYALGWSGLSIYYGQGAFEELDPREALPQEEAAARKAVELDDTLPEAHLALGGALFFNQWNWVQAEREIDRAIELNPEFAEGYHFRSKTYTALNRYEEAIQTEKKATELDPLQRPFAMAFAYLSVRQYDAAINDSRLKLEAIPQDATSLWTLSEAYRCQGKEKESVEEWGKALQLFDRKKSAESERHNFEQGGYKAVLRGRLNYTKKQSADHYVSPIHLALLYAQLGDREQTLALLEEGYRQRAPDILWIQNDPAYDFLHSDERYRSIINRIGLPPAW